MNQEENRVEQDCKKIRTVLMSVAQSCNVRWHIITNNYKLWKGYSMNQLIKTNDIQIIVINYLQ